MFDRTASRIATTGYTTLLGQSMEIIVVGQRPATRFILGTYTGSAGNVKGSAGGVGYACPMNEQDGLDPTVAMPRIDPAAAPSAPAAGAAVADPPRAPYAFGNPFVHALRRTLAFSLDLVVVAGVATMLLYGLIAINPFTGLPNRLEGGFDATLGMGIGIALLSVWLFEAFTGTTLGKLAFGLHVYAVKGRFVGIGRAFTRNLVRPLDALVIGLLLVLLPGHRRIGDLFGGTVVANSPLRAFSPLIGWLLIAGLCAVPFFVASGPVTVFAVGAAFVQFVPPLIARTVHGASVLLTQILPHAPLPSDAPTALPTDLHAAPGPSDAPSALPAAAPTAAPTDVPTVAPTVAPTVIPADAATDLPLQTPAPATTG